VSQKADNEFGVNVELVTEYRARFASDRTIVQRGWPPAPVVLGWPPPAERGAGVAASTSGAGRSLIRLGQEQALLAALPALPA
jgi:hypothetical protein